MYFWPVHWGHYESNGLKKHSVKTRPAEYRRVALKVDEGNRHKQQTCAKYIMAYLIKLP